MAKLTAKTIQVTLNTQQATTLLRILDLVDTLSAKAAGGIKESLDVDEIRSAVEEGYWKILANPSPKVVQGKDTL